MEDSFVDQILGKIFKACSVYLNDQYRWQTGMKVELDRLRENYPMVQDVVSAYNRAQISRDPKLNSWIWKLRDVIDGADDVLDDLEYEKLEQQNIVKKIGKRALMMDPNLKRLEKVVKKLDNVSAEVSNFLDLLQNPKQEQQKLELELSKKRETGCSPENDLIGRDEEKDIVMQWLRNEDQTHTASSTFYKNISLLSIVGHGGMGKTALLQHIYANLKQEFQLKMWVCVSNDFDAKKVITDMLEFLNKERPRLETLAALKESLKDVVQSKKFLLVLDDIWEEDMSKWENVLSPLTNGSFGSKILLTTRMDSVASAIANVIKKKVESVRIKGLEENVCLQLLKAHAFADVENLGAHAKLSDIASSIVKKLSGCPLLAKIIGGVLNSNLNKSFWMNIKNSTDVLNIETEPGRNNIVPILRLSFTFLPQRLQNCFAFCGIFQQDHVFDKDELVRMWIALGFIQEPSIKGETLEDIGGRYFDVLLRKSFFEEFQHNVKIYYKMHDLLHDLAQYTSSEECFRFVGDDVSSFKIPKTIRHLFVETENLEVFRMIKDAKNLHSFFLITATDDQRFTEILTEIFKASSSIRLLFIDSIYQKKMPEAIKKLRHLRYLNLMSGLTQMPRSLSSLYHLQFISFQKCEFYFNDLLPGDVSKIVFQHQPPNVFSSVRGIGKLRSLQELNEFNVKNENGYRIGELEHMNELRKLKVNFLENVKDAGEAGNAKLFEKRKLTDLFLNWGKTVDESDSEVDESDSGVGSLRNFVDSNLDVNVLENLKPYKNLKRLSIASHKGVSSAKWMYEVDLISNLEYISLEKCMEWETLPPFGQLPHLKSLYLRNMPKAKRLDYKFYGNDKVSVFPSLEVLHMEGLQVLEDLFDKAGAAADDCFFPCLTELFLVNCPNLQELSYLPPKLKKMKIQNIGWKAALNCKQETNNCCLETLEVLSCPNITSLLTVGGLQQVESGIEKFKLIVSKVVIDDPSLLPTVSIASLEKLTICNNDVLVSFPIETEQWFLHVSSSLRKLSFKGLKSLQSLPSFLERLSSIKILRVEQVPQLQQLLHIPTSLEELHLGFLESLQCLPSSLSAISSLNKLYLFSIPLLKSLPDLPSSLEYLNIKILDNLECLPSSLSAISSLKHLYLESIALLKSLPDLPSSLDSLSLWRLDNLECLPSSLSAISSLHFLGLFNIPLLKSLPDLPSSLDRLSLWKLDNLECLPFLSAILSLKYLYLSNIPLLKSLPDFPSSLEDLEINFLDNLECLPSSLSAISSLKNLDLKSIPLLKSLPYLPSSVNSLTISKCRPTLVKRYKKLSGSDWHKIAHIPYVTID